MSTNKINDITNIKQARLVNGTLIIIHIDWISVDDKDIQIDENGRPFQETWGTDIDYGFATRDFKYLDEPFPYKNELQFLLWSTIVGGVAIILRSML